MHPELAKQIQPIIESCQKKQIMGKAELENLAQVLKSPENADLFLNTVLVLSKKFGVETNALQTLFSLIRPLCDETRSATIGKIFGVVTADPAVAPQAIELIITLIDGLLMQTPRGILDHLDMHAFDVVAELLYARDYYGLIITLCTSHPELASSYLTMFRLAQSHAASDEAEKALKVIESIKKLKLNAGDAMRTSRLESSLFHRVGENEKAIEIISPHLDNCDSPTLQTLYGFHHYSDTSDYQNIIDVATRWYRIRRVFNDTRPRKVKTRKKNQLPRVGFISHSFHRHPVGWLTAGAFTELFKDNPESFYMYSCRNRDDFVAKTLRASAKNWKNLEGMPKAKQFETIRKDGLDLLIDLDGMTATNAFDVVCSRPAIATAKWVGGLYGSTYVPGIDYLIGDRVHCPDHLHHLYTEKLILFSSIYATYTPPPYKLGSQPPPSLDRGYVTFGSSNNAAKLSDSCLRAWVKILSANPRNKLLIKDRWLADPFGHLSVHRRWIEQGGNPDQLRFAGASDHEVHLDYLMTEVDILLDPIPYSGGLSTLEAVFLGIPVITLAGDLLCHRHSTAHLTCIGATELIATTQEQYVDKAINLSNDPDALINYRKTLKDQLLKSPLLDHKAFAAEFRQKIGLMVANHQAQA